MFQIGDRRVLNADFWTTIHDSEPFPSLGNHCDLNVLREAENLGDQAVAVQELPGSGTRACQKDLGDLMTMGELNQSRGRILALQDSRFDMKIARKVEMFFNRVASGLRQIRQ